MKCPACETPLGESTVEGISFHFCPGCGGQLSTREAFRSCAVKLKDACQEELSVAEALGRKTIPPRLIPRHERTCPRCGVGMTQFNYAYDSNIILDRCLACEVIWADKGEVAELALYIKSNPTVEKLGKTLADWQEERADFRETIEELPHIAAGAIARGLVPVSDELEARRFALVTVLFILANIAIFVALPPSEETFQKWGSIPSLLFAGRELHRLLTSQFVHVNLFHLGGNMLFLWIFGDNVEDWLGRIRFLFAYVLFGVVGDIAYGLTARHSGMPCVGASGAVSGVMGCYLVFFPGAVIRAKVDTGQEWRIVRVRAFVYLGWWFVMQLIFSMTESSVAYFAHVGGFVSGAAVAVVYRMLGKPASMQQAPVADAEGHARGTCPPAASGTSAQGQ